MRFHVKNGFLRSKIHPLFLGLVISSADLVWYFTSKFDTDLRVPTGRVTFTRSVYWDWFRSRNHFKLPNMVFTEDNKYFQCSWCGFRSLAFSTFSLECLIQAPNGWFHKANFVNSTIIVWFSLPFNDVFLALHMLLCHRFWQNKINIFPGASEWVIAVQRVIIFDKTAWFIAIKPTSILIYRWRATTLR